MDEKKPFIMEIAMEMAFPHFFLDQIAKEVSPEKARECAMSTSVGGIGPLLKDRIFGQADLGLEVMGVSLLYDRVWVQAWHEWGQLNLQKRGVAADLKKYLKPTTLNFDLGCFDNQEKKTVEVWQLNYGAAPVYFLSCPPISDTVYPGPKDAPKTVANPHQWAHEFKLKQSWLLGRGALTLSKKLGRQPDFVVLSETPSLFGQVRIVQDELQKDPFFADTKFIFNDHTPLEYAHPIWDQLTIESVKLDPGIVSKSEGWNPQKKSLDVTSLLVGTCDGVFGVAKKHGEVMRSMPSLKGYAAKIDSITNGVRKEDWQDPAFASADKMTDEQLVEAKQKNKKDLLEWAWRRCRLWRNWVAETLNRKIVILTRRITPYKRLDVLLDILENGETRDRFLQLNLAVFVGGRIHQQDNHAQDIVYDLLEIVNRDEHLRERVIFLDNFNIWEAPLLYKGADASIMMADDTREASATGFMKAQMNGAAVIATPDGAIPEFVRFEADPIAQRNGFLIPYIKGEPTPHGLLEALEQFERASSTPQQQAMLMRAALALTPQIDVARTVREMKGFYDKLALLPPLPLTPP